MLARLRELLIKEFIQVLRDPRARFALIVPPLLQILIFGYAASFDVRLVPTAVLDHDHSMESRELIARFAASGYFAITDQLTNRRQIARLIDRGDVTLALQIMPGFAEKLRKGETASLQAIVDGTDSNTAMLALRYIGEISNDYSQAYLADYLQRVAPQLVPMMPSVTLVQRPWYNTNLESEWFFVPGTIGSLILTTVLTMTAFAVVREREVGTLEQIMVTPIRSYEFILGKTIPYVLIALAQLAAVSIVGIWWFEIPFRGSLAALVVGSFLFIVSVLAVGLFISTISSTQQQAMIASFFFIMPAITLSGFTFPISSMPPALQWLTYLDPLRYYLVVLRSAFLKGGGFALLWPQMLAMAGLGLALLGLSVARSHMTLD